MSDPVLQAEQLTKRYSDGLRDIEVLADLDLNMNAGEWVAVVGASGAGKSTLLNLLGGLDNPTSGVVRVAGRSLSAMTDRERSYWRNQRLGFVFQMHHLLPEFSAIESVAMPARIGGISKRDAHRFTSTVGSCRPSIASPRCTIGRGASAGSDCASIG